jgi:multiple sugar transport system ATP-binding protein
MGRAIVRHPQAFLMDEPLSNLDAKLRVQTRSEIARIQADLGVTTVYVTHDQVEAMTMGDRVAVLRKGELQQVGQPQVLYDHPVNLFVAGFIGSPAMNLVQSTLRREGDTTTVDIGSTRLIVPDSVLAARPDLRGYDGREIVLGIRPEDMEDASLVAEAAPGSALSATVELVEALGSDVVIHFTVDAPPAITDDVKELAHDVGVEHLERVQQEAAVGKSTVTARLSPRTPARPGDAIQLAVDTSRLHFFDPDDGSGIYGGT